MLSKLIKTPLMRPFSGGHDPYWLHLEQQHDNYPQYAHLHWHTVDPAEVGKYANLRSKSKYGDHVSEDPAPVEWLPEVGDYRYLDADSRNAVYFHYLRFENDIIPFLKHNDDPIDDGNHRLIEGVKDTILSVLKPKQVKEAKDLALKIIAEYKAAGIPVTREAVDEKVRAFLLKSLSKHQAHDLQEGLFSYLSYFGYGLPLNED
jgi:hypothetical protein